MNAISPFRPDNQAMTASPLPVIDGVGQVEHIYSSAEARMPATGRSRRFAWRRPAFRRL